MADLRDKLERERRFSDAEIELLAGCERAYLAALGRFYNSLPSTKQALYGASAGTPKAINILEYSELFRRFDCIALHDTGIFAF
jgi:hypothetical protein